MSPLPIPPVESRFRKLVWSAVLTNFVRRRFGTEYSGRV